MNKAAGQVLLEVLSMLLLATPLLIALQQQWQQQALLLQRLQHTMQVLQRMDEAALALTQQRFTPSSKVQALAQGQLYQTATLLDAETGRYRVRWCWQWATPNAQLPMFCQQGLWFP